MKDIKSDISIINDNIADIGVTLGTISNKPFTRKDSKFMRKGGTTVIYSAAEDTSSSNIYFYNDNTF